MVQRLRSQALGQPLAPKALHELEPLNRLLGRDEAFSQISRHRHNGGLELQVVRRWRSPESLLLQIGEALAKFVREEDFTNVKSVRGTQLHAAVRRPYPQAGKKMVQHGDLRQSRQACRAP